MRAQCKQCSDLQPAKTNNNPLFGLATFPSRLNESFAARRPLFRRLENRKLDDDGENHSSLL